MGQYFFGHPDHIKDPFETRVIGAQCSSQNSSVLQLLSSSFLSDVIELNCNDGVSQIYDRSLDLDLGTTQPIKTIYMDDLTFTRNNPKIRAMFSKAPKWETGDVVVVNDISSGAGSFQLRCTDPNKNINLETPTLISFEGDSNYYVIYGEGRIGQNYANSDSLTNLTAVGTPPDLYKPFDYNQGEALQSPEGTDDATPYTVDETSGEHYLQYDLDDVDYRQKYVTVSRFIKPEDVTKFRMQLILRSTAGDDDDAYIDVTLTGNGTVDSVTKNEAGTYGKTAYASSRIVKAGDFYRVSITMYIDYDPHPSSGWGGFSLRCKLFALDSGGNSSYAGSNEQFTVWGSLANIGMQPRAYISGNGDQQQTISAFQQVEFNTVVDRDEIVSAISAGTNIICHSGLFQEYLVGDTTYVDIKNADYRLGDTPWGGRFLYNNQASSSFNSQYNRPTSFLHTYDQPITARFARFVFHPNYEPSEYKNNTVGTFDIIIRGLMITGIMAPARDEIPLYNMGYGTTFGQKSNSQRSNDALGITNRQRPQRFVDIVNDDIPVNDAFVNFYDMTSITDIVDDVLFVYDEADDKLKTRRAFRGRFENLAASTAAYYNGTNIPLRILERIT